MQPWSNFFEMVGAAAATLLGLLFVSVSVNAQTILGTERKHPKRLAEQAFQNYLAILFLSLFALFAGLSASGFGYSILGATAIWSFWILTRVYLSLSDPDIRESRWQMLRRYIAPLVGFGLLVYAGFEMVLYKEYQVQNVATALLVLLVSATVVSWELLISVAQEKYAPPKG
jgi:hypothetical protein